MTTVILDPTDEREPIRRRLTARPEHLRGTVTLLDINKTRGDVLLDRLAIDLADRFPDVDVKRYVKPTFAKPAPEELRHEILEKSDFVVEALAD